MGVRWSWVWCPFQSSKLQVRLGSRSLVHTNVTDRREVTQVSPTREQTRRCLTNTIAPGEASNMLRQTVWEARPFSTNGLGGQTGQARPHWADVPADRCRRYARQWPRPADFLRILSPTVCYAKPLSPNGLPRQTVQLNSLMRQTVHPQQFDASNCSVKLFDAANCLG